MPSRAVAVKITIRATRGTVIDEAAIRAGLVGKTLVRRDGRTKVVENVIIRERAAVAEATEGLGGIGGRGR